MRENERDGRRRNLWPLPGGAHAYVDSVRLLLAEVGSGIDRGVLEGRVPTLFPGVRSQTTARGYVSVLVTLGLVDVRRHHVQVTPEGRRFMRSGGCSVLREALVERVYGVQEVLDELVTGPSTCPDLTRRLAGRGISWNHPMAVRYRVWWLIATEAVQSERRSRVDILTATSKGLRLIETPERGAPKREMAARDSRVRASAGRGPR